MAAKKKPKAASAKRATRHPVAKKTRAKKTARSTARKTASKRVVARRPTVKKPVSNLSGLGRIGDVLDGIKLSGAASVLLAGRRKDIEALLKVSRKSYREVQSLVERRSRELKYAIGDWKQVAKEIRVSDPKDIVVKLEAIGNQAFKLAVKNLRDLSQLATKSQGDTLDVIKKRIRDNVADVKKLLNK